MVCLQFITNTGDNASNVGTFNYEIVELLAEAGRYDLTADGVTIRCLSHIIHLAVTDLLVGLKAVKKTDIREDDVDLSSWSESRAEETTAAMFSEDQEDNRETPGEEGLDVDASVFVKVSHNKSQSCHYSSCSPPLTL